MLGDAHRLSELIENLATNAIRYTAGCERREIAVRLYARRKTIMLEIQDTGIGIPEDELGRVRERLYRATNAQSRTGTGFGLAIADRIARQYGAALEIESAVACGTTAYIRFLAA